MQSEHTNLNKLFGKRGLSKTKMFVPWIPRKHPKKPEKIIKFPLIPINEPDRFMSWSQIKQRSKIGLVLTKNKPFIAFDVDHTSIDQFEKLDSLVSKYPTYIEYSPSGNGYRILYQIDPSQKAKLASKPVLENPVDSPKQLQLFISTGYVTLTNNIVTADPRCRIEIAEIPVEALTQNWPKVCRKSESDSASENPVPSLTELLDNTFVDVADIHDQPLEEMVSHIDFRWIKPVSKMPKLTPLSRWLLMVRLDEQDAVEQYICRIKNWNHYDYWLACLTAIRATWQDSPLLRKLLIAWSKKDLAFESAKQVIDKWESLEVTKESGITAATYGWLYQHFRPDWPAKSAAGTPNKAAESNYIYWLNLTGLKVVKDALTDKVCIKGADRLIFPIYYEDLNEQLMFDSSKQILEDQLPILQMQFNQYGLQPTYPEIQRILYDIAKPDTRPFFAQWLDQYPWDGHDYITELLDTIIIQDKYTSQVPTDMWRTFFTKMLYGVSRSLWPDNLAPYHRNVAMGGVPILMSAGRGGEGKSTLPSLLFPHEWSHLAQDQNLAALNLKSKDALITLKGKLIVGLSEIDVLFEKTNQAMLKDYITKAVDVYRPPYGKAAISVPRTAVFIGSTNHTELKFPEGGYRRWWVMPIKSIDIPKLREFNKIQLWCQVREVVKRLSQSDPMGRAPWELDDETQTRLTDIYNGFRAKSDAEIQLDAVLQINPQIIETQIREWETTRSSVVDYTITILELCKHIDQIHGTDFSRHPKKVGHVLRRLYAMLEVPSGRKGKTEVKNGFVKYGNRLRIFKPTVINPFRVQEIS